MISSSHKLFLSLALIGALSSALLSGCYASGRPPESARAAAKNVEYGAGKVIEGTGKLITAGVDSIDRGWTTPAERVRRRRAGR